MTVSTREGTTRPDLWVVSARLQQSSRKRYLCRKEKQYPNVNVNVNAACSVALYAKSVRSLVRKAHALHTKPRTGAQRRDHFRKRKHNLVGHNYIIIRQYSDERFICRATARIPSSMGVCSKPGSSAAISNGRSCLERIRTSTADRSGYNLIAYQVRDLIYKKVTLPVVIMYTHRWIVHLNTPSMFYPDFLNI